MSFPNRTENAELDIYRDTLVRYLGEFSKLFEWNFLLKICEKLGYSNEVGEAFRSLVKKQVVHASYAVAIGYVLCDTVRFSSFS